MAAETARPLWAVLPLGLCLAGCPAPVPSDPPASVDCGDLVRSPVFSLRKVPPNIESTVRLDPGAGVPYRRHRPADLLVASGLRDEPFQGFPGQGPNIHAAAGQVLNLPAAVAGGFEVEIDSLSAAYRAPAGVFYLAFSVHHQSQGTGRGGMYNVAHQQGLGHVGADVFFGLPSVTLARGAEADNNHLDPGGIGNTLSLDSCWASNQRDFDLGPRADRDLAFRDPYDDIDGLDYVRFSDARNPFPQRPLFFTVDTDTADALVAALPEGLFGGSDILQHGPAGFALWADNDFMDLSTADDIDALLVLESGDGEFGVGDVILVSLAAGSPTLRGNGWSPADVLKVTWKTLPERFIEAADVGLAEQDELDGLTFVTTDTVFGPAG